MAISRVFSAIFCSPAASSLLSSLIALCQLLQDVVRAELPWSAARSKVTIVLLEQRRRLERVVLEEPLDGCPVVGRRA